jgi:hypothetical protein
MKKAGSVRKNKAYIDLNYRKCDFLKSSLFYKQRQSDISNFAALVKNYRHDLYRI